MTAADLMVGPGDCLVIDSGRVLLFTAQERRGVVGRRTLLTEFTAPAAVVLPELPVGERWLVSPDIGAHAHVADSATPDVLRAGLTTVLTHLAPAFEALASPLQTDRYLSLGSDGTSDIEVALAAGETAITQQALGLEVVSGTLTIAEQPVEYALLPAGAPVYAQTDTTVRLRPPDATADLTEPLLGSMRAALAARRADALRHDQVATLSAFESATTQQVALAQSLQHLADEVVRERSRSDVAADDSDPYSATLARIAAAADFAAGRIPGGRGEREGADAVLALANASGVFMRRVALRGDWYQRLMDAAFGFTVDGEPTALLPVLGGVDAVSPLGQTVRVTEENASTFAHTAFVFSPEGDSPRTTRELFTASARVSRGPLLLTAVWGIVLALVTLVVPLSADTLFNEIIPNGDADRLLWLFGLLLVAAVATLPVQVAFAAGASEVVNRSSHHHMRSLWSRVLRVPSDYVAQLGSGEVVSRFVDLALVAQLIERQVLGNVPVMLAGLAALIAVIAVAPLPGALVAILLTVTLGVGLLLTRRVDSEQQRVSEGTADMRSFLLTVFEALAKVRVTAAELIVFQRWTTLFRRVVGADLVKLQSRLSVFATVLPALATFLLIASVALVGVNSVDAGAFVAMQYLVGVVVSGGVLLIFASVTLHQQFPIVRRILELSDAPIERGPGSGQDPGSLRGAIDLVGVSFTYPGTGRPILDDITLSIKPGESVAIVGPSGSGKSTLLRLLLGFETPSSGVVLYDGRDLRNLDVLAVRRQLGVVLQDSALDSGQIRKNVSGSRRMRDSEIWEVLEAAAVADDVRAMPMRLETPLTFGGGGISGGQRQRLLIARALATQPHVLILDEATSALDNLAQATISANLDAMGITRIIVAHRLSTIENADRIIVLDGGRIAQEGSFADLVADENGLFHRFAARQLL